MSVTVFGIGNTSVPSSSLRYEVDARVIRFLMIMFCFSSFLRHIVDADVTRCLWNW